MFFFFSLSDDSYSRKDADMISLVSSEMWHQLTGVFCWSC